MNQSTKQRIVGTLVLLIAALVLLPVLLDGDGSYEAPLESRIPDPPPFEQPARSIPERPVILADGRLSTATTDAPVAVAESDGSAVSDPASAEDSASPANVASGVQESGGAIERASEGTSTDSGITFPGQETPAPDDVATAVPVDDPVAVALAQVASRTPRLDPQGLPRGWSVRLGVFGDAGNAATLVERLKSHGHRAYTRASSSNNGPATAVYVGPLIDRASAESLLESLRADVQLDGLIVPYEIETR